MIAIVALVLAVSALFVAAFQLALGLLRKRVIESTPPQIYIDAAILLDQRSFLQATLRTMALYLEAGTAETRDPTRKVVRLLVSTPILVASPVISDQELSIIERDTQASVIWIVTSNESIEFAYPSLGGEFSAIIAQNVQRGIQYRYLVADSPRARERRRSIVEDFEGIQVRLFDRIYWSDSDRAVDEYVIYGLIEGGSPSETVGYYQYPGSNPRRWIKMDSQSAIARLRDAEAQWVLSASTN
jgi:hypothetical protein